MGRLNPVEALVDWMLVAPACRSVAKWLALAGLVAALAAIYLLTEQSSADTMALTESTVHGVAAIAGGAAGGEGGAGQAAQDLSGWAGPARRAAHVAEYLAVGALSALSAVLWLGERLLPRVLVALTLGFCFVASLLDQTHRLFVPGREFDAFDLTLDAAGYLAAAGAVFLAWRISRRRGRRGGA